MYYKMNSLLVCNLYNALYEVCDVHWIMIFGTCNVLSFDNQQVYYRQVWKSENWTLEPVIEQSDEFDYYYMFHEL